MKEISKIAKSVQGQITGQSQLTTTTHPGISPNTELPEEAKEYINRIFERMIVIVPAWKNSVEGDLDSWVRRYKAELAASLKDAGVTTGEQIKSGIQRLRRSGTPFLPSPGGFSSYCMKKSDSWQHNTGAYHVFDRKTALPAPKADKETAGKHIAGMKTALTKQR